MDNIKSSNPLQSAFFWVLAVGTLVLLFLLFRPFLNSLFFAAMLAIVFYPAHRKILVFFKDRQIIAALASVFLVFVLVLIPIIFIGVLLFQEAAGLYLSVSSGQGGLTQSLTFLTERVETFVSRNLPTLQFEISDMLTFREYGQQALSWILQRSGMFFSGFVSVFFSLFIMILALFYFFKDGLKFKDKVISLIPFSEDYSQKIVDRVRVAVDSVVRGRILLGIIQGVFAAIGFFVFSIPNPVLWGTLSAVLAILPAAGPIFVILPAAAYSYFFLGSPVSALGLIVWALISAVFIDNYLGSKFIEKGLKIHPFLILLSVLGGLAVFGPIGFVLGPVSIGIFFALIEVYPLIARGGLRKD